MKERKGQVFLVGAGCGEADLYLVFRPSDCRPSLSLSDISY